MVNFNGEKFVGKKALKESLISFLNTDYPNFEFLFVDNNSGDRSTNLVNYVLQTFPLIKIIKNSENLGFAGGCNSGLKYADGEYIALINNDDKAANPKWLKELVNVLKSNDKIGACFSKKFLWDNPERIDSIGNVIDRCGFIRQLAHMEKDNGQYNEIEERLIWQTPVLIRREIIEKVGGLFDPEYFIIHDDTDLSWRIWLAGYKIIFVPKSIVYHKRSATVKKLPPHIPAFHGKKNILMTLIKNYGLENLIKNLPIHLFIFLLSVFYYLVKKRCDLALSCPKAVLWNLKNFRHVWGQRKIIQNRIRKMRDEEITKHMDRISLIKLWRGRGLWPR